ncbi:MAG: serine hydrolase [Eubacterium sp.]|nr:serine hydrolase [Eubacterium sp.]
MKNTLERGSCSENGINPRAVYNFIERNEKEKLGVDSFMLLKGGKVVAEGYYNPYTNKTPHVEFSLSKSMSATALGFALDEGKVSLDDSICKYFPEYGKLWSNKRITVRHLVTMTAGKMIGMATARHKEDWIKIFFDTPPIAPPGKLFLYVNDNFYLISAIISRVYGVTLVDFLEPRLFKPLGIEKPFWEIDSFGYAAGGWGLYMPIEDLAKIMRCYSQMGKWNGKQVIPEKWIEEATKFQTKTVKHGQPDVAQGYGYGIWMTSIPNAYRFYGLYGQLGYVFKDRDTVLVVNSGISKDMYLAAAINDMCKTLWDTPEEAFETKLKDKLSRLGDKDILDKKERNTALERKYSQKPLKTRSGTFASMLPATMSAVFDERVGHIDRFILDLKDNGELWLMWKEGEFVNEVKLGMDGKYAETPIEFGQLKMHACTKAAWLNPNVLRVIIRIKEACVARQLDFDFSNEKHIRITNNSIPDLPNLAAHYVDFSGIPLTNALDSAIVKYIAPAVLAYGEPTFRVKKIKRIF